MRGSDVQFYHITLKDISTMIQKLLLSNILLFACSNLKQLVKRDYEFDYSSFTNRIYSGRFKYQIRFVGTPICTLYL